MLTLLRQEEPLLAMIASRNGGDNAHPLVALSAALIAIPVYNLNEIS